MILLNSTLYMSWQEALECGFNENTLKNAKLRNSNSWEFVEDPSDKRRVLIGYEKLKDEYKAKVKTRFGNPYDLVSRQPILNMVVADAKAEDFFNQYRYADNKMLPIKAVRKYTRAASWLTMLDKATQDRKIIKKLLSLTIPEFYLHCAELIRLEKVNGKNETYTGLQQLSGDFPSTYQRLMAKVDAYKATGYAYLIDPMYGNKLSAKIGKTEEGYCKETAAKQEALIRKAATLHMNLDAVQIMDMVNVVFEKNNWPTISSQTVTNLINKHLPSITPARRGAKVYNSNVAMQVKREAPKNPAYYFTLDGWTVELLYQDASKYDNRLVAVVVLDPCCKYPVGYAIGDRENTALIAQALRNAISHLHELFGNYYRPWQIQSDRYGIKALTPFYAAVSHLHTPAAVGNAKSKIIEPYFKHLNKTYCQTQFNWSGFGITARKENQVNTEFLDKIKHSFPDKAGVVKQITAMLETERAKHKEEYVTLWQNMPEADKLLFSKEDLLMVFGKEHQYLNTVTGEGLIATLAGHHLTYDSFDPAFRAMMHSTKFKLVYDEDNLNQVLALTEDGKQRFLLHKKQVVAMDIKSTTPEMLDYRKQISDFNSTRKQEIIELYANDNDVVEELINNTPLNLSNQNELSLKLMLTYNGQQKERLQDARGLATVQRKALKEETKQQQQQHTDWATMQRNFLEQKTNINEYL